MITGDDLRSTSLLDALARLHPRVIDLSLGRMERVMARVPEVLARLPPVIHVAGTNGKGSTIAFLRSLLEASKLCVHTYTSPHLVRFHERIRLGAPSRGELIDEEELVFWLEEARRANGEEPITIFEITTVAAFLAFAHHVADYLLLEVGLGGRLDATNVVRPRVCVITRIDRDHEAYLGTSLEAIALEKAGIMKPGVPTVVGRQYGPTVLKTLKAQARRVGAPLLVYGEDWEAKVEGESLVFSDERGTIDLPKPPLLGAFQTENAGLALAVARLVEPQRLAPAVLRAGILGARWPGRVQRLSPPVLGVAFSDRSEIWLDGGHNPSAGEVVARFFQDRSRSTGLPVHLLCGMLETKDAEAYFKPFCGGVEEVQTVAIPGQTASFSPSALAQAARRAGLPCREASSVAAALERLWQKEREEGPLCAVLCGSLYLAGWVLGAQGGTGG